MPPKKSTPHTPPERTIVRVQTGIRVEKRILKVLKGTSEYLDMSLSDLIEGIVLHAFDGKCAFGADTLERIQKLRTIYDLDLTSADSHTLIETHDAESSQ